MNKGHYHRKTFIKFEQTEVKINSPNSF